ncbi:hypothetical protein V3C99_009843, partial [Haemonchus contortus]|uniref:Peptidase M12A domain-containing protein n=1 Tax=Haemonchus contortus TaxID=6289 RepID=A0A7I4YJU3_HAECO
FASSGNSMTPRTAGYARTMGSQIVSFYDIRMINIFYKCNVPCNGLSKTAKCLNGGAPHPKNCKTCLCPHGYGGGLCGQRVGPQSFLSYLARRTMRFTYCFSLGKEARLRCNAGGRPDLES